MEPVSINNRGYWTPSKNGQKFSELPSVEYLNECFSYNQSDGWLYWKSRPMSHFANKLAYFKFNKLHPGKRAGFVAKSGYVVVKISCSAFKAHRIIWSIINGGLSDAEEIDHKNCIKSDNRPENLRLADRAQNTQNKAVSTSSVGLKGVTRRGNGYVAQIGVFGENKYIGYFSDPMDAHLAYVEKAKEFHGEFMNTETV